MKKIGLIGCGNIAAAIVGGAVSAGCLKPEQITCFDIDSAKAAAFARDGMTVAASAGALAREADVLFLTVKPQVFPAVIGEIRESVNRGALIVTPAAGIKIAKGRELFGFDCRVIRVMPNTPLMYAAGATAMVRGAGVEREEFSFIQRIFSSCGVVAVVEEEMIDIVTGISGSSPAFFMRFAREIILEGVRQGMNRDEAERLVVQTMAGTAKMMNESPNTVEELIQAVASPNGTTEAGLKTMDRLNFDRACAEMTAAAIARSRELSK